MTCYCLNGLIFTALKDWTEVVLSQGCLIPQGLAWSSDTLRRHWSSFVGNFVELLVNAVTKMFTHHKLKVYEKALALGTDAEELSAGWGRRHAIVDHFRRASEIIVLNIAEGARLVSGTDKAKTLDYALGSTLECAACLDIASIKGCLSREKSLTEKRRFLEITRMLIGLRKAWLSSVLSEEPSPYQAGPSLPGSEVLFHHESLDV